MKKPDGGAAFPSSFDKTMRGVATTQVNQGASLRDLFAGLIAAGLAAQQETLLANHDLIKEFGTNGIDKLQANKAYRLADAMIAERDR